MNISLKPQIERYIDDQIKAGRYQSAADVLEDAVSRMMNEDVAVQLDEQTLAAIDESEDQIKRGEFRNWKDVSSELRSKYLGK